MNLLPSISIVLIISALADAEDSRSQPGVEDPHTPDLSKMFSLDRLSEYNQLIDCISKIRPEFTRCNLEAKRKGEKVLKFINEKWELATLIKCCGVWLVRDCWLEAATEQCSDAQVDQLRNMPSKFMPGLEDVCHKYPSGSFACHTPYILGGVLVTILVLLFITLIVAIVLTVRFFLRRHRERAELANDDDDDLDHEKAIVKHRFADANNNRNNNNNNNNRNEVIQFIDSDK